MADAAVRSRAYPKRVANGRFEIRKTLGAGCFGKVYRAINTETQEEVAVKFEDLHEGCDQLQHEAAILEMLREPVQPQGFATKYYFAREGHCRLLVMEFLGRSLEESVQACGGTFHVQTTVLVADQLLRRMEYLHSKGLIHQDIKPENFVWGVGTRQHHLYVIDFGLSKRYWKASHVRMRQLSGLVGTARYASINAHRGLEQSRRDDLEAVGHMLLYFLRGSLPWSGLQARNLEEKYRRIMEKKAATPLAELCEGFPGEFPTYLSYCRKLGFKDRPNYAYLRGLFLQVREALSVARGSPIEDHEMQWNVGQDLGRLAPLDPWPGLQQPDDAAGPSGSGWAFLRNFLCRSKEPPGEPTLMLPLDSADSDRSKGRPRPAATGGA